MYKNNLLLIIKIGKKTTIRMDVGESSDKLYNLFFAAIFVVFINSSFFLLLSYHYNHVTCINKSIQASKKISDKEKKNY